MDSDRLTRRRFVAVGVGSAVAVGALDAVAKAGVAGPTSDVVVGRFIGPEGARSAVVSLSNGHSVRVTLDSTAFVAHGTDGVIDTLTAFVPGETVVIRGATSPKGIVAVEFQSLYTDEHGTVTADGAGYVLVTSGGRRVRVPQEIARLRLPSGVQSGAKYAATVWTDPRTGEATALTLDAES